MNDSGRRQDAAVPISAPLVSCVFVSEFKYDDTIYSSLYHVFRGCVIKFDDSRVIIYSRIIQ